MMARAFTSLTINVDIVAGEGARVGVVVPFDDGADALRTIMWLTVAAKPSMQRATGERLQQSTQNRAVPSKRGAIKKVHDFKRSHPLAADPRTA